MLSIITGVPGSGKTLYTVDKLLPLHEGRLLTNINGLTLPHVRLDREMCEAHDDWFRPGDLVVIDEAQDYYPNRAPTAKLPEFVSWMTKHRHDGVDVILITQHPLLIDSQLRRLVNRHIEVRRLGKTSKAIVYEWDRCSDRVDYKTALAKTPYLYSKNAFANYKSAELHTKPVGRMPAATWIGITAVLIGLFYVGYHFYSRFSGPSKPAAVASSAAVAPAPPISPALRERMRASRGAKTGARVSLSSGLAGERLALVRAYGEAAYWCARVGTTTCKCGPAVHAVDRVAACSFPGSDGPDLPPLPVAIASSGN